MNLSGHRLAISALPITISTQFSIIAVGISVSVKINLLSLKCVLTQHRLCLWFLPSPIVRTIDLGETPIQKREKNIFFHALKWFFNVFLTGEKLFSNITRERRLSNDSVRFLIEKLLVIEPLTKAREQILEPLSPRQN